jgi:hypothetical protein
MWDLYIFYWPPRGCIDRGSVASRWRVYLWMAVNIWRIGELRAIHRGTGEHIVRW